MMAEMNARIFVIFRLTNSPITFLLLVYMMSGIIGSGIRKLRITWLTTSSSSGSYPSVIAMLVGMMLMIRMRILRTHGLNFFP